MKPKINTLKMLNVIGMTKKQALAYIKKTGMRSRIKREDDQSYIGTMDLRGDRVNLELDNNLVVKAYIG